MAESFDESEMEQRSSDLSMETSAPRIAGGAPTKEQSVPKSSILGASFNFVNSIVGAGVIGMPHALRQCGLAFGIVMIVCVAAMMDKTIRMIIDCGVKTGKMDYEELLEHTHGRLGRYWCMGAMFLMAYGAMIGYSVIIGDTVGTIAVGGDPDQGTRALIIFLFSVVAILPLCLLRSMAKLSWPSFLSISCDVVLIVMVAAYAQAAADDQGVSRQDSADGESFLVRPSTIAAGVGTMSFAFVCQHSSFIVRNSLADPTPRRWGIVTHLSVGTALALCVIMGLGGYLAFYDASQGDILNNFADGDRVADASRALLALTMVFTFPMEHFVARQVIYGMFFAPRTAEAPNASLLSVTAGAAAGAGAASSASDGMPARLHYGITFALWGTSTAIAMLTDDLGLVLSLTGAIAASSLGFILPAIAYRETYRERLRGSLLAWKKGAMEYTPSLWGRLRATSDYALVVFLICFGALVMVLGTTSAILEASGDA